MHRSLHTIAHSYNVSLPTLFDRADGEEGEAYTGWEQTLLRVYVI